MRLASVRLRNVGPFDDVTLRFAERGLDADEPPTAARPVTVVFGGDGTGKTSLLSALALTRPGYSLPPLPAGRERPAEERSFVVTEWMLGEDDPERPHPLIVASPAAVLDGESGDGVAARRREQALFDRRAQQEGGYVFVAFSGARWFSRASNVLTVPDRSILRYDVRHPTTFDDPTRADLTRETKQILAYAAVGNALGRQRAEFIHLARFDAAVREVVDVMLEPFGLVYAGVNPTTLEPEARGEAGRTFPFDAVPRAARHLVAFVVHPLRALFAAYPAADSPRELEAVVAIDDLESQQDPALLRSVAPLLRRALPNVQWILTTASTHLALACDPGEIIALRRTASSRVELGEGVLH
jgi:AAA domain-containing protein